MSTKREDEQTYDVERILSEKTNDQGEVLYLVKWLGYPHQECTWELSCQFDTDETFLEWTTQKAKGDILGDVELRRIQAEMDLFQSRQASDYDAVEESDFSDRLEGPKKRPKLVSKIQTDSLLLQFDQPEKVHGAPPPAQVATKRGIARPQKPVMKSKAEAKLNKKSMKKGGALNQGHSESQHSFPAFINEPAKTSITINTNGRSRNAMIDEHIKEPSSTSLEPQACVAAEISQGNAQAPTTSMNQGELDNITDNMTYEMGESPLFFPGFDIEEDKDRVREGIKASSRKFDWEKGDPITSAIGKTSGIQAMIQLTRSTTAAPATHNFWGDELLDEVEALADELLEEVKTPPNNPIPACLERATNKNANDEQNHTPHAKKKLFGQTLPLGLLKQPSKEIAHQSLQQLNRPFQPGRDLDLQTPRELSLRHSPHRDSSTLSAFTQKPVAGQDSIFPGLQRHVHDLGEFATKKSKLDTSNRSVMLAYVKVDTECIQLVREWLVNDGLSKHDLFDRNTEGDWLKFTANLSNSVCVILFDIHYPVSTLPELSRFLIEHENLICWQVDFQASSPQPLPMTRLFLRGTAMVISEACFLHGPNDVAHILKWFKLYSQKHLYPSSMVMFPPKIASTLLDQAKIASSLKIKDLFINLANLVHELLNLSMTCVADNYMESVETSGLEPDPIRFTVVDPAWASVYGFPEREKRSSVVEQKQLEEEKEKQLFEYFSAWALRHRQHHRKFYALRFTNKRLPNAEHIRFQEVEKFLSKLNPQK